jgi:hypothetical protein
MLIKEILSKDKRLVKFNDKIQLIEHVDQDLQNDFDDYSKEFQNSEVAFEYFLGTSIFFKSGVEVTRRVYNSSVKMGGLYDSLVIKRHNNLYYYWKF